MNRPDLAHVTVNRLNHLFAELRGSPVATIEMYSRGLRKAGVLPETRRGGGGTSSKTIDAANMLCAIMRGSPVNAAADALEIGGLNPHLGAALMDPILDAELGAIGWREDITFAGAIGSLIEHFARGTIHTLTDKPASFWIEADRYWTTAALTWSPSPALAEAMVASYSDVFGRDAATRMLDIGFDGRPRQPLRLDFHSPHLLASKIAFREGDGDRNREAHAAFHASKVARSQHDVWGTEKVGSRTLSALGELFRPVADTPVIAERQTTITEPGAPAPGQTEDQ